MLLVQILKILSTHYKNKDQYAYRFNQKFQNRRFYLKQSPH